ncbi:MAG: hypothetical protein NTX59_01365 [Elusimicrobia bacterium]|nr:hypothetical protein [Elusimicrobiota bacterium]
MNKIYLLVLAMAALSAAVFFILKRHKAKRRKALVKIAEGLAVDFEEYGPELQLLENTGLPLFIEGGRGFGKNLLRFPHEDGFEAYFFDYICLTGDAKKQINRQGTVALFGFKKTQFPVFYLAADDAAHKPDLSGFEPVDTSSFARFPAGLELYGSDVVALHAVFNRETATLFTKESGWSAQGAGRYLLLYKGCGLVSPHDYPGFIEEAKTLAFRLEPT